MKTLIIIVALISIAGCTSKHELAKCKGPLVALNGDRWTPSDAEIAALEKLCPEDR